jgi:hypothetical protein
VRAVLLTALLALTLAAPAEPSTATGLRGHVIIGPLTPVCREGTPCDGPAKRVALSFIRAGRTVRTRTDVSGNYRLVLAAGSYSVRPGSGRTIRPANVLVVRGRVRAVNFSIDTGIR